MIKLPRDLATSINAKSSNLDGPLEAALRELLELRDQVRKAELAAVRNAQSRRRPASSNRR